MELCNHFTGTVVSMSEKALKHNSCRNCMYTKKLVIVWSKASASPKKLSKVYVDVVCGPEWEMVIHGMWKQWLGLLNWKNPGVFLLVFATFCLTQWPILRRLEKGNCVQLTFSINQKSNPCHGVKGWHVSHLTNMSPHSINWLIIVFVYEVYWVFCALVSLAPSGESTSSQSDQFHVNLGKDG